VLINLNLTMLLLATVIEGLFQAAFALWSGESRLQQIPGRCGRRMILVSSPSMKEALIIHELSVSRLVLHMQPETLTYTFQELGSFDLLWQKGGCMIPQSGQGVYNAIQSTVEIKLSLAFRTMVLDFMRSVP